MALNEGQLVTYALDEIIETVQNLTPMASKVTKYTPPAESMQRSSNTVWMPVEQEAPTQTGWDLTGNATGILELSVKCNMGDPDNDFFELRADDLRDERSYRRRIQASAKKLANNIESAIAKQATEMGSLVVHDTRAIGPSTGLSGWDFVSDAERLMFSRELNRDMGISYFLNPDDYRKAGRNLVDGDIFGRVPEEAYRNGTIQRQIAGFDEILRSPKLPAVTKSTATGVTVSGAQKFKPQAYTLDTDGNKENVDNRVATVTVSSTTGFKRGDKISFTGVK
ncbi:TPA: coat protein, partial [Escherichia coli]|nr:coat protein [Escherichia coli]HCJ8961704.1 coat protein [Escherichia coli]